MLTEAEQYSLDLARNNVRSLLRNALDDIPEKGEDICQGDFMAAILLSLGGGAVSEYLNLVKALQEPLIHNMKAAKGE